MVRPLAMLFVLLVLPAAVAGPADSAIRGERVVGTVTVVDEHERTFRLETDGGDRIAFYWDDSTALLTRPAAGLVLKVYFERDAQGRFKALRVGLARKPGSR